MVNLTGHFLKEFLIPVRIHICKQPFKKTAMTATKERQPQHTRSTEGGHTFPWRSPEGLYGGRTSDLSLEAGGGRAFREVG